MTAHRRPLTRSDLIAGCRLAMRARDVGPVEGFGYDQCNWPGAGCGTAHCVHGFAMLAAGAKIPADGAFDNPANGQDGRDRDYVDVDENALEELYDMDRTDSPERILAILGVPL